MNALEIALPADWHEVVKAGKYGAVQRILHGNYPSEAALRMALLTELTGIDGLTLGKQLGAGNTMQRNAMADAIDDFLAEEIIESCFPALDFLLQEPTLTDNPYPSFIHDGVTYKGPDNKLNNQTGHEWRISHHALFLHGQTQDLKHLYILLAANYHRCTPAGERLPLCEEEMLRDAQHLSTINTDVLYGFLTWYMVNDQWWFNHFEHLFPEEGEGSAAVTATGQEVQHIIFELAENSIGANWDVVNQRTRQDLFYALDRLNDKRIAAEEALEKSK